MRVLYSSLVGLSLFLAMILMSAVNGYISDYIQPGALLAYVVVFFGLCLITFGYSGIVEIFYFSRILFFHVERVNYGVLLKIGYAIRYSYMSSCIWILGCVGNGLLFDRGALSPAITADIAVALMYGVVTAEIVLRPIHNKVDYLLNIKMENKHE